MIISPAGLREIESSEGWSSGPYLDRVASPPVWTAYFGETKGISPSSPRISRADGEARLRRRFTADYAPALDPFVHLHGFTQNMYDALASFIWNCGRGAVAATTKVGRALRARQWHAAADAMLEWCKNGAGRIIHGLQLRRQREIAIFLTKVDPLAGYRADEQRWIREYDALKRTNRDASRREVLRRVMTKRRKAIWTAAKKSGWDVAERRARYASLRARTT